MHVEIWGKERYIQLSFPIGGRSKKKLYLFIFDADPLSEIVTIVRLDRDAWKGRCNIYLFLRNGKCSFVLNKYSNPQE